MILRDGSALSCCTHSVCRWRCADTTPEISRIPQAANAPNHVSSTEARTPADPGLGHTGTGRQRHREGGSHRDDRCERTCPSQGWVSSSAAPAASKALRARRACMTSRIAATTSGISAPMDDRSSAGIATASTSEIARTVAIRRSCISKDISPTRSPGPSVASGSPSCRTSSGALFDHEHVPGKVALLEQDLAGLGMHRPRPPCDLRQIVVVQVREQVEASEALHVHTHASQYRNPPNGPGSGPTSRGLCSARDEGPDVERQLDQAAPAQAARRAGTARPGCDLPAGNQGRRTTISRSMRCGTRVITPPASGSARTTAWRS